MIKKRTSKAGKRITLILSEELIHANTDQFHSALMDAFKTADEIVLELAGIERVDLGGLQILCGAWMYAENAGKVLCWDTPLPTCIREVACSYGLENALETARS